MAGSNWAANAARQYCLWKAWITLVVGVLVSVGLLALAVMLPRWMGDTSKYVAVDATVIAGGSVSPVTVHDSNGSKSTVYSPSFAVTYVVGGKTFSTFAGSSSTYPDQAAAAAALAAATGSSKRLFYDPADPTKTTKVKNVEKWVSAGAAAVGVAVLACAVLGFLMRNNAVFCGMGIAANASSALFGR